MTSIIERAKGLIPERKQKPLDVGQLKVFDSDLSIGEPISSQLADYLTNLVSLISRGHRISNRESLRGGVYWLLQTRRLQRVELLLNGKPYPSYSLDVDFPQETVEGREYTPVEQRIDTLRRKLQEFDEDRMDKNSLDKFPVIRFTLDEPIRSDYPVFTYSFDLNTENPRQIDFQVKALKNSQDEI